MIKATHFRHPMKFTGNYHGGHWSGYRYKEPLGYTSGLHTGVDYNRDVPGQSGNADEGDVVYAIAAGKVVYKGDLTSRGYGLTVIIEHHLSDSLKKALGTDKLYSRYMHLSYYGHLNLNSWVNIGHEIANVGRTGTQWAHLHIDLWKGNLGAHLEYHKDTQLASYLNPYTTIENYREPKKNNSAKKIVPKREDDMVTREILNILFRFYLAKRPAESDYAFYVGKMNFNEARASIRSSNAYARVKREVSEGRIKSHEFMPQGLLELHNPLGDAEAIEKLNKVREIVK